MKLNFTGAATAALSHLTKKITALSKKNAIDKISRELAEEAHALIKQGFRTGTDPYGRPWPRPKRDKTARAMYRTGRLASSWRIAKSSVYSTAPYAGYLQQGTRHMYPRRMVPARTLPPRWRARFEYVIRGHFRRLEA